MVIGFNHELFTNVISPNSKKHEASTCNFNSLGNHLFQSNEIWMNRDLVKSVCDLIAKYDGWDTSLHQKKSVRDRAKKERGVRIELLAQPWLDH